MLKAVHIAGTVCIMFIISCSGDNVTQLPMYDYVVNSTAVTSIGGPVTENKKANDLLGNPISVRLSGNKEILVADRAFMKIKVFSSTGTYIKSIGNRGRRPGEYLDITSMFVDESGALVVSDEFNRRLTIYKEGNYDVPADYYEYSETDILWPRQIQLLSNGSVLMSYRTKTLEVPNSDSMNTFHIYDGRIANKINSFGPITNHIQDEDFPKVVTFMETGVFRLVSDNKLIFAPTIYDGTIYEYENNGEWVLANKIYSNESSLISYNTIDRNDDPLPKGALVISGKIRGAGVIKRQTVGLFIKDDGSIVHISSVNNGEAWHYYEEIFDKNGKSEGVGYFKDISNVEVVQGLSTVSFHDMKSLNDKSTDIYYVADIATATVDVLEVVREQM